MTGQLTAAYDPVRDADQLRKDIRDYVREGGHDALSFALLYRPKYDRVPGREIQRMIDEERVR